MRVRWGNVMLAAALVAGLIWWNFHRPDLDRIRATWPCDQQRPLVYVLLAAVVLIAICALNRLKRGP